MSGFVPGACCSDRHEHEEYPEEKTSPERRRFPGDAMTGLVFLATLLSCNTRPDKNSNETKDFPETEYGENIKAGHHINIRGFEMYYETYGEGEPLLLIHGNDGSIRDFHKNIPYFHLSIISVCKNF